MALTTDWCKQHLQECSTLVDANERILKEGKLIPDTLLKIWQEARQAFDQNDYSTTCKKIALVEEQLSKLKTKTEQSESEKYTDLCQRCDFVQASCILLKGLIEPLARN